MDTPEVAAVGLLDVVNFERGGEGMRASVQRVVLREGEIVIDCRELSDEARRKRGVG